MEMIDNIGDEYKNYWETTMFLQSEELDGYSHGYLEEAISGGGYYDDSSSPDGTSSQSSSLVANSKNIVSERNRRKKLNQRLYALRAVVPNITKMDKASIIKDAIEYIKSLHDEERRIEAEISQLESGKPSDDYFDQLDPTNYCSKPKRTRIITDYHSAHVLMPSPIELLELRVSSMGEKTAVVSLTCSKKSDTMVRLCEIFETLNLKIITANITAFSARLLKTVFLEADKEEIGVLRSKIEAAIAALNDPDSPMSST